MQKICIVIPCYNEEKRFNVVEFNDFYSKNSNISFLFVNDGSSDNTLNVLNCLTIHRENKIRVHNLTNNSGKAEAVRQGMLNAYNENTFDFIGYFDADFATPLSQIFLLSNHLQENDYYQISFGSRIRRMGSTIERTTMRHYFGRIFSTIASLMLKLPVYDTQCGAKLFRSAIIPLLFDKPFLSRWLFDVEIFARIVNKYGKESDTLLIEVPLKTWLEKGDSKISIKYLFKVPFELFKIHNYYKL